MVTISFTEFRKQAAVYFNTVENGEVVRITRHGKVVADIVPSQKKLPSWKKAPQKLVIPGVSLSRAVLKERKES